jgi:hypothetical protein
MRVIVIDARDGKVGKAIVDQPLGEDSRRDLWVLPDGKRLMLFAETGDELRVHEIGTGEIKTRLRDPDGGATIYHCELSPDGGTVTGTIEGAKVVVWDLASGKAKSSNSLVGIGENAILRVLSSSNPKQAIICAGQPGDEPKVELLSVDVSNGEVKARMSIDTNSGPCGASKASHALVFRQQDPREMIWTSIQTIDRSLKLVGDQQLKPPFATGDIQISDDGETAFLLEYMVQAIVIRDLKRQRWAGVIAPALSGSAAFGLSSDGKTLVAYMGDWKNGSLQADRLAIFDVSEFIGR